MDRHSPVSIELLAGRPELVSAVGEMRWDEWGHAPEPAELAWWVEVTEREAGRDDLPITFVAVTPAGDAVGAVGLDTFDIEERHDRSPWVVGTIVHKDWRGKGAGAALMRHLETWAASRDIQEVWVAMLLVGLGDVELAAQEPALDHNVLDSIGRNLLDERDLPDAVAIQAQWVDADPHTWGFIDEEFTHDIDTLFPQFLVASPDAQEAPGFA